ncbi:MAG: hypothetical protein HY763_01485 [Planctomycetes bacterium]|nr:hypothetical protein [Planctomycetota bacterium]
MPAGSLGGVAAYRLPKVEGDTADGSVRVTFFPDMKGKDEMNIDRWLAQVKRPNGQPCGREDARTTVKTVNNNIRVVIVDINGTLSTQMMGGGGELPNQKMIAAIINDPAGPHFVKATGPHASITKWSESIYAFIESARTE